MLQRTQRRGGGIGRTVVTGIRWQESSKRAKREMRETCKSHKNKLFLHPIIDWTEKEVWEYIHTYNVPYCTLYDEGFKRIGCIMCPFATQKHRMMEAQRWPKYAENYKRAINKAYEKAIKDGLPQRKFKSGDDVYKWWMTDLKKREKEDDKLIPLFGLMGDESML